MRKVITSLLAITDFVSERGLDLSGIENMPAAIALWMLSGGLVLTAAILWVRDNKREKPSSPDSQEPAKFIQGAPSCIIPTEKEFKLPCLYTARERTLHNKPIDLTEIDGGIFTEWREQGRLSPPEKLKDSD